MFKFLDINRPLVVFLILTTVVFTAYSFLLPGTFSVLDDQKSIVLDQNIKNFSKMDTLLTTSFFGTNSYYRPLVSLSFMLDYYFFRLNPFFYHLENILLHIAS